MDDARRETTTPAERTSRRLLRLGMILFLLGLLTGFAIPGVANPRMGLASHLEGVMNGLFLVALGLVWPRLRLAGTARTAAFCLAVYGTFANWAATLLAAVWGAGASMPLAGQGREGTLVQEWIIDFGLYSLSLAMVLVSGIVIAGLGAGGRTEAAGVDRARNHSSADVLAGS